MFDSRLGSIMEKKPTNPDLQGLEAHPHDQDLCNTDKSSVEDRGIIPLAWRMMKMLERSSLIVRDFAS